MGITSIEPTTMKTRDVLVAAAVFSALEAVALNAFAPHLRPAGGVGRLLERFFIANIILYFLYGILIRPYFVSPLRHIPGPKGGSLIFGHALNARRSKPPGDQFRRWMEEIPNDGIIRNRNTGIWGKDAMEFIPQRWIDADGRVNNSGGVTSNYSIMTFLHGPRSCIGQGFARSELKCLVAALVGRYDIKLTRERDSYYPAGLVTTKAANGMWLKFGEVPGW